MLRSDTIAGLSVALVNFPVTHFEIDFDGPEHEPEASSIKKETFSISSSP